jgi:multidrug efflux pump subunit AcrB
MNFLSLVLRRPVTLVVAIVALALTALFGLNRMAKDVFPPLNVPTIYVAQPFGGMEAGQMEGFLTYYYEYHFLYITGIEHVESKNIQGAAVMKLQFHPGTDMSQAMSETVGYVNRARAMMPPGTVPPFVMRFDAGSVPIGQLVFASETRTVAQLQDAALNTVRPLFATLPGVSAPPPFGGSARSILVNLIPDRLRSTGVTPEEVAAALAGANVITPAGNLTLGDQNLLVPVNSTVKNIKDLENVPIRPGQNPAILIRDVAQVVDGADAVTSYALVDGRRTVYIPVTKRSDASTLSVVSLVKDNLSVFQAAVPADIKVSYEMDQSPIVSRAINDLFLEALLGAVLTGLMVFVFLRDARSTLVVVINIPLALLIAVLGLWLCGQTINLMTLGGLALAVGILVDEATVAIEAIQQEREKGRPVALAVRDAIRATAGPRFLAMACVVAVFVPSLFMEGSARALFLPLSLAVGFSMIASYVLSSTLLPVLAIWLLKDGSTHQVGFFDGLKVRYAALIDGVLARKKTVVLAGLIGGLALVALLGPKLGREIFPSANNGQLQVRLRAPAGTKLDKTEQIALQALGIIKAELGAENVGTTLGLVGVHAPNYPVNLIHAWNSGTDEATLQVQLKAGAKVDLDAAKENLRRKLGFALPDVRLSFEPADIVSRVMSFGAPTPIEIAVSGPAMADNRAHAEAIRAELAKISELRDIQFAQTLDAPALEVNINREKAGLMGIKLNDAARSVVEATGSSRFILANYWADPKTGVAFQVQVQIPGAATKSVEDLRNLPVGNAGQQPVLLRSIATLKEGVTVAQYDRYNMQRLATLTANYAGTDLGHLSTRIDEAIAAAGKPPAKVKVDQRGQVTPLRELFAGLGRGLLIAFVIIALLLAANFQSIRLAGTIIAALPIVLSGVILGLLATFSTLNIESYIGAIMAVGVAVANAILLITAAEQARLAGADAATAARQAGQTRLRAILMTSFAMLAGMVPMALGWSEAGSQTAPLARAVMGGLIFGTVATLTFVPALYAWIMADVGRASPSVDPDDTQSTHYHKDHAVS